MPECIDVMADALAQLTRGEARQPLRTVCTANQPACVMSCEPCRTLLSSLNQATLPASVDLVLTPCAVAPSLH